MRYLIWLGIIWLGCLPGLVQATICVADARADTFCLDEPAERIITLAPHLTESVYHLDAQSALVGAVAYSDYPPAAKELPRVGSYRGLDLEAVLALQPDLVIAWAEGGLQEQAEKLSAVGIPVWHSSAQQIEDVPVLLQDLGRLTGFAEQGVRQAQRYEQQVARLAAEYRNRPPLSGFFEIWPSPLTTVTPEHYIGAAMALCGVENIVTHSANPTPQYSEEAVIKAGPEVLIATQPARDFERWQRWPAIPAVANDHLVVLPEDLLDRIGPRLPQGIAALCEAVDLIRSRP